MDQHQPPGGGAGRSDRPKPPIQIHVDKQHVSAPKSPMTGAEIRQLHRPPIGPERDLYLKVPGPGDDQKVADGKSVDLTDGMHFFSVPSQINPGGAVGAPQGAASMGAPGARDGEARYTGLLLDSDVRWLDDKGYSWTLSPDGNGSDLLVLHDYPLAPGRFNRETTDLLLLIPKGYNDAKLDMWWAHPAITLAATGAHPVAADHYQDFLGRRWQRFSRHLPGTWRAGIDDLPRYMAIIAAELQRSTGA